MSGKWLSAAFAVLLLATSTAPTQAFTPTPPKIEAESDATEVQYRPRGYYRYGDRYYYNGYRGYRYYRPGYRYYDGGWYPRGAFSAGVIIGGPIARPRIARPPMARYGNRHVDWCYARYRSYRAYDNTYQPYSGPRRQCYSPYS
ncbi:BA14K family protein [Ensifer sp. IC4062]|nr:BA14K family protein [Ensifer sp. IC4062]MCA1440560.1 BA14K family protein [Ensifer sp. IC4062]